MRNISRTRSMPATSSVTGCSTWRRVLTSRKGIVPSRPTRSSTFPAPTYPASLRMAFDARYSSAFCSSVRNGAGASSTSFWWRRWREQSRVETTTTLPWVSARHWVSTWRGLSREGSAKHSPRPEPGTASPPGGARGAGGPVRGGDRVTEVGDGLRGRADPDQARVQDRLSELGVLGEEAVSGMDGVRARLARGAQDLVDVQIAGGRGVTAQSERLIRGADMRRVPVRVGVHGHARDTGIPAGPGNADSDFA